MPKNTQSTFCVNKENGLAKLIIFFKNKVVKNLHKSGNKIVSILPPGGSFNSVYGIERGECKDPIRSSGTFLKF